MHLKRILGFVTVLFFLTFTTDLVAQNEASSAPKDSVAKPKPLLASKDSTKKKIIPDTLKVINTRPRKAGIASAILPGLGQIYNKKYWKAPLFWAGLGGCGYMILRNDTAFKRVRAAYRTQMDADTGNEIWTGYSPDQLNVMKEDFRRKRDLFIIVGVVVYAVNILDAVVDAHLFDFDVSDDLTLHAVPYVNPFGQGFNGGLQLNFTLGKHENSLARLRKNGYGY